VNRFIPVIILLLISFSATAEKAELVRHTVMADGQQLEQLFQNLLANALKFRGTEPPRIHVSAVKEQDVWTFRIRDNGIGIAPEHHDRIFDFFARLHSKEEYPGTGIGLAVCKKIVGRHKGRLWVDSEPGSGCAFCFTLLDATSEES